MRFTGERPPSSSGVTASMTMLPVRVAVSPLRPAEVLPAPGAPRAAVPGSAPRPRATGVPASGVALSACSGAGVSRGVILGRKLYTKRRAGPQTCPGLDRGQCSPPVAGAGEVRERRAYGVCVSGTRGLSR